LIILIKLSVPQLKLSCFARKQVIHSIITPTLRHHQPIRRAVLNNHHSNLHLQLSIFMQQNLV